MKGSSSFRCRQQPSFLSFIDRIRWQQTGEQRLALDLWSAPWESHHFPGQRKTTIKALFFIDGTLRSDPHGFHCTVIAWRSEDSSRSPGWYEVEGFHCSR